MDNNFMIIILAFILGYMVDTWVVRLVEGFGCDSKTQPISEGYGTVVHDERAGSVDCIKCRHRGMAVNEHGKCVECIGTNKGLGEDFKCKDYNNNYYHATRKEDGEVNYHYEQLKKPSRATCTQHGWGNDGSGDDTNDTCNPWIGSNDGYCMKKIKDTRGKNEQECSCWNLSTDEVNNGFWLESSYFGGNGDRAPPEKYVECSYQNI